MSHSQTSKPSRGRPTISKLFAKSITVPAMMAHLRRPATMKLRIEIPSRNLLLTLHQNISSGDLVSVNKFLNNYSFPLNAEFLHYRSVLHAAIVLGQLKIFKLLVSFVSDEDLHLTDNNGNTAMSFAAMHGNTEIAECLFKRNQKLVTTVNLQGGTPVLQACTGGHKDTLGYLYSVTPIDFLLSENKIHGSRLLNACILSKQFDVAFDLIRQCPAISLNIDINFIPLVGLTEKSLYLSGSRLAFWQRWIYYCLKENKPPASTYAFTYISGRRQSEGNKSVITQVAKQLLGLGSNLLNMFGIKQIYDLKSDHANAMELLRRIAKYISTLDKAQILEGAVRYAMIGAAKLGVTEFIIEMWKANPDVMSFTDDHGRNIFMIAAVHRQEKVFSLICGIPALTGQLLPYVDIYGNALLHLAAELGPDSEAKLTQISGAALQMQRELQWFKETKNILPQVHARYTNNKMQTAKQIFDETHKDLCKQGEEWMKQLASSSTVVGTLIMTIMFAAAFIVPGGNDQNNGFPIFLTSGHKHEVAFMIFIISDAISLFASSTSVLMFLGILTTRYAMEDFLTSLPNKLIIGLSTLFISIATMMAAFCASLVIMLQGRLCIIIPIILLASIPITLFAWLQFPLLVEVIVSTYGVGIFDRKMKPWI
ncbi:Ankyrin repeat family protein, putative isoform 1 [Theobroma cacao]|uniref:Ankyrin repeat family protein, putative isoform 1 n=1 Tax=Theobroma cacao TaxID=3641 RepID=S1RWP0_THECC|nr:Ankyrin repeat family protein, putative isoform 1 [Theobroma cacao]